MWNCWPERYGKFQSEIPSTSGAICEKPQGGPLAPPPAGRGLMFFNGDIFTRSSFMQEKLLHRMPTQVPTLCWERCGLTTLPLVCIRHCKYKFRVLDGPLNEICRDDISQWAMSYTADLQTLCKLGWSESLSNTL